MAGEKTSVTARYAKLTVEKFCTIVVNSLLFVVCIATFSHFCTYVICLSEYGGTKY